MLLNDNHLIQLKIVNLSASPFIKLLRVKIVFLPADVFMTLCYHDYSVFLVPNGVTNVVECKFDRATAHRCDAHL